MIRQCVFLTFSQPNNGTLAQYLLQITTTRPMQTWSSDYFTHKSILILKNDNFWCIFIQTFGTKSQASKCASVKEMTYIPGVHNHWCHLSWSPKLWFNPIPVKTNWLQPINTGKDLHKDVLRRGYSLRYIIMFTFFLCRESFVSYMHCMCCVSWWCLKNLEQFLRYWVNIQNVAN